MRKLPWKLKLFIISVYTITFLATCIFTSNDAIYIDLNKEIFNLLFFTTLIALTESNNVIYKGISFSTSFSIHLAVYILYGPLITIILMITGFSCRVLKDKEEYKHILNTPWYKSLFNYCVLSLPVILGNYFYVMLGGEYPISQISNNFFQIMIFCILVFIGNTIIISILTSLLTNKSIVFCLWGNVRLGILNILIMAPFGLIIAVLFMQYSYKGVLLLLFPVLLVRYTFLLYIQAKTQYIQTVDALMRAMEARDKYTEGHSQRVSDLSIRIAKELKYNDWKIEDLKIAALLHDVGKIGIDDSILNKPGRLSDEEYNIIKSHPDLGYNILKEIKNLESIIPIVRNHHERYDGKGYPDGKTGEELGLDVFIVQLADSIDAMATDRPYRKAMEEEKILEEIKKHSGTQFHPKVVEAYLKIFQKEKRVV